MKKILSLVLVGLLALALCLASAVMEWCLAIKRRS